MYSRYDIINDKHSILLRNRLLLLSGVSLIPLSVMYIYGKIKVLGLESMLYLMLFMMSIFIFDKLISMGFPFYAANRRMEFELQAEMESLKEKMRSIIQSVKKRGRSQQFKIAYSFTGNIVDEFEYLLAIAMHYEVREVWVTAFCKSNVVLKVTATIGSERQCRPSDDIRNWRNHVSRLRCDEVRQYHNHPITNNRTSPSQVDILTDIKIRKCLPEIASIFRAFIVFWNNIYEYRILEYHDDGRTEIHSSFDVSTWLPPATLNQQTA